MKRITVLIILLAVSIPIKAQLIEGYGLKAGLGITNNDWEYTSDFNGNFEWDNNYGVSLRAFADFFDFQNFQLEGEAAYSRKGTQKEFDVITFESPEGNGTKMNIDNQIDYLSFALMAKLKLDLPVLTPYLLAGPQFNYRISDGDSSFELVYKDYKNNIFGITLGLGTEINLMLIKLLAEYRYERDLVDNYSGSNLDIQNYSHTILVGIKF